MYIHTKKYIFYSRNSPDPLKKIQAILYSIIILPVFCIKYIFFLYSSLYFYELTNQDNVTAQPSVTRKCESG